MLMRMAGPAVEIVPCPASHTAEALALVLEDIAPSQRHEIAAAAIAERKLSPIAGAGLFVALRGDKLCGAAWGQHQPGNTAVLWPPRLVGVRGRETGAQHEDPLTAKLLVEAVGAALDGAQIAMTQVLLSARDAEAAVTLKAARFHHLADLIYLTCEAFRFPAEKPDASDMTFEIYDESQRGRLMELVERTYERTLDCAGLNGTRKIDEVIDGYEATGAFRRENWLFVQAERVDVGVLMLADHPSQGHWELMYMGLTPEARGRGRGEQVARHALWLAGQAHVERVVLAVDAINAPARAMYGRAGFIEWDRRSVFVRFLGGRKD